MKIKTEISVLMCIYKEPIEYIKNSIDSIINQTFKNFELIIILDNPYYEEARNLLNNYHKIDNRINFDINIKNMGLAMSLNKAFSLSNGEYIARMDADDISLENRLEEELKFLKKHKCEVVFSQVFKMNTNKEVFGETRSIVNNDHTIKKQLLQRNIIVHPTVLMTSKIFKNCEGYRNFPTCQDYDFWLRIISSGGKFGALNKKLVLFRRHENSISVKKHWLQFFCEKYALYLYHCRKKSIIKEDNFSEKNLNIFLEKNGYFNTKKAEKEGENYQKFVEIKSNNQYNLNNYLQIAIFIIKSRLVRDNIKKFLLSKVMN